MIERNKTFVHKYISLKIRDSSDYTSSIIPEHGLIRFSLSMSQITFRDMLSLGHSSIITRERRARARRGPSTGISLAPAPSRDIFVAWWRREWRWTRRPNYELFSPRHGGHRGTACTHLPGASPFISRKRARAGWGEESGTRGEESVRTSLCGILVATYGNVIRAFRRMLSCVFALLRNRPFSRPRHPRAPQQRESMSMRAVVP